MYKKSKLNSDLFSLKFLYYGEKKLFKIRKLVNYLYFQQHMSLRSISKQKHLSKDFVGKWTKSPDQNFYEDNRGWPKGKRKQWDKEIESKIRLVHQALSDNPRQFYTGATAIKLEWDKRFPSVTSPPLRTIGQIFADLQLSSKRRRDRHKGATKYLCYPEYTIYNILKERVAEVDFIGQKFINERTEPINFTSFCFKKEPRLRYFQRVEAQTADCFIQECNKFFNKFERPDYIKVDNCLATIGSASGKRNISKTMQFLLKNQVIPIFSVPRKPFSQASIEGNNSVFSRKFWNRIEFKNTQEIDQKIEWFNKSSQEYCCYKFPEEKKVKQNNFTPKIYFIRQVKGDKESERAYIDVLNEKIYLRKPYIHYFVLVEWNLKEEKLYIRFEKNEKSKIIKTINFTINSNLKF